MRPWLFSSLLLLALSRASQAAEPIRACGGDSNWPPMSYILKETNVVEGLSVEILKAIFRPEPEIRLRPWARCIAEVEATQGSDVMMSSFKTPEREMKFHFSRSYVKLTPAYFYSRQRFSTPPITTLKDLNLYKVCSLHGASTAYLGTSGPKIESGATNYLSLIRKIDRGHCEIVVDMKEVFFGLSKIGVASFNATQYQILPLPETKQLPLHFAISKTNPQAARILDELNQGINQLEKNGKLKQMIQRGIDLGQSK